MTSNSVTAPLCGHAATVLAGLEAEMAQGRFPHGIILAGPQGIGKATLAYAIARKLLGGGEAGARRIAAGSHTDLRVIAPLYDEKKEEFAREISAEQTRDIPDFLSLTPAESIWRVVIVDGAETMTMWAANAILKILEEPPPSTALILVAHHASRLLPTIRSRCRMIKIAPLSAEAFSDILREQLPEIDRATEEKLGMLSDHSPGLAIELYRQGALDMFDQLELIFAEWPAAPHARILAMAERVASGNQHRNWRIFTHLVLQLLAANARAASSGFWAEKWQTTSAQFALVQQRHLDYKSSVIHFFNDLASKTHAA